MKSVLVDFAGNSKVTPSDCFDELDPIAGWPCQPVANEVLDL